VICFGIFIHAELHIIDFIRQKSTKAALKDVSGARKDLPSTKNDKNVGDILKRLSKLPSNLGVAKPQERGAKNNKSSKVETTQRPALVETQRHVVVSEEPEPINERTYVFNIEDGNLIFPEEKHSDSDDNAHDETRNRHRESKRSSGREHQPGDIDSEEVQDKTVDIRNMHRERKQSSEWEDIDSEDVADITDKRRDRSNKKRKTSTEDYDISDSDEDKTLDEAEIPNTHKNIDTEDQPANIDKQKHSHDHLSEFLDREEAPVRIDRHSHNRGHEPVDIDSEEVLVERDTHRKRNRDDGNNGHDHGSNRNRDNGNNRGDNRKDGNNRRDHESDSNRKDRNNRREHGSDSNREEQTIDKPPKKQRVEYKFDEILDMPYQERFDNPELNIEPLPFDDGFDDTLPFMDRNFKPPGASSSDQLTKSADNSGRNPLAHTSRVESSSKVSKGPKMNLLNAFDDLFASSAAPPAPEVSEKVMSFRYIRSNGTIKVFSNMDPSQIIQKKRPMKKLN